MSTIDFDMHELDDTSRQSFGMNEPLATTRLVISVDFGTTYTGVAFATPQGERVDHTSEVTNIQEWHEKMLNEHKVPSVITFSDASAEGREANWGSSIAPKAIVMKHMKLKLDVQSVSEELNFLLQLLDGTQNLNFQKDKKPRETVAFPNKTPEELVTLYLEKIWTSVLRRLEYLDDLRSEIATDIVITIPVEWSYIAKNATYRAMNRAGFNKQNFPGLEDVMFVREPEAAAIWTARHFDEKNEQFLREKECFIVCDAGGGTVDIVSYKVKQVQPLVLERIGYPTGEKCGSIFIDWDFKLWLRQLIGERNYQKIDPDSDLNRAYGVEGEHMRKLMDQFDTLKKGFHQESDSMYLGLPPPLKDLTMENPALGRVDQGQITITNEKMRDFFNPRVDTIIEMIKDHIDEIDSRGSKVKNLFLIGGFGSSEFLQQEIKDSLELRDNKEVRMPADPWTAVVKGAVICGVEKSTMTNLIRTSAAQKHYGIAVDESFGYANDAKDEDYHPISGKMIARNQMRWLINKGDVILANKPTVKEHKFTLYFRDQDVDKKKGVVIIYSNAEEEIRDRPTRLANSRDDLDLVETLHFDLTGISLSEFDPRQHGYDPSKSFYATVITLRLTLTTDPATNSDELKAELLWKGQTLNPAPVDSTYLSDRGSFGEQDHRSPGVSSDGSYVRLPSGSRNGPLY